ncbi:TlpA family protein disulfide reductase [Ferruginibacter sp.]
MRAIYCFMIVLCSIYSMAQSPPVLKPLVIGDQVPNLQFSEVLNAPYTSTSIAAWADKLLLVDFWATWCGSCIKEFPKLQALQASYSNQLQVLLINNPQSGDKINTITQWLVNKRLATGGKITLPVIMDGEELGTCLPHHGIPYTAWIYKGKLVAATDASEVTAANIRKVLAQNESAPENRLERNDFDIHKPLAENLKNDSNHWMQYQSLFTSYIKGAGAAVGQFPTADGYGQRKFYINKSFLGLYYFAFPDLLRNHIILDSSLKTEALCDTPNLAFKKIHYCCYEQILPLQSDPSMQLYYMKQDLDRFFGITSSMQKRLTNCYVLTITNPALLQHSLAGDYNNGLQLTDDRCLVLKNAPLEMLVTTLNMPPLSNPFTPIVIDETGYTAPANLRLCLTGIRDLTALQQLLPEYGLALHKAKRWINMLVLTKTNFHQFN